jgi:anti-sigma-K factor RskA
MQCREMTVVSGEYVLGLLSEEDAAAAETRMKTDPAFGAAVAAWRDRLVDLHDITESVHPSSELWIRIRRAMEAVWGTSAELAANSSATITPSSLAPSAENVADLPAGLPNRPTQ